MRLRTIAIVAAGIGAVLLLLLAASYFVLRSMDLDSYRPEIIARVKAATGRDLTIGAKLEVVLRDGLLIRANQLTFSNAKWSSQPRMLTLGRAEAHLALLPLLGGKIRIERISLHDVDLVLETDASGKGNWIFDTRPANGDPMAVEVDSIEIKSGRVTWRTANRETPKAFVVEKLESTADVEADTLIIKATAQTGAQELELSGRMPSILAWSSGNPLGIDLNLRVAGAEINAKGTLRQEKWGINPLLTVNGKNVDLSALSRLAGHPLPVLPPLDFAFGLSRDAAAWQIANIEVKAGTNDLSGKLQLTTKTERPQLSANLSSQRLTLAELTAQSAAPAEASPSRTPLLPSTPLELDALRALDLSLQLNLAQVAAWNYSLDDLQIAVELNAGRLIVQPVQAQISGGGLAEGSIELDAATPTPHAIVNLKLRKIPASALLAPAQASLIDAPADLQFKLEARGNSLQSMVGALSGHVRLLVHEGRAQLREIDTLVGGLSTITGQLLERNAQDARLNCVIADFPIEHGVATANVLLIDSAAATLRGDGQIDLGAQTIDLTFTPRPKKPTLSVAVPVHVRGPLRQPKFTPDRTASLTKLIGVAGIFVYPPAALAALGDLGATGDACADLIQDGAPAAPQDSVTDQVEQGIRDVQEGLGQGLNKLFGD